MFSLQGSSAKYKEQCLSSLENILGLPLTNCVI